MAIGRRPDKELHLSGKRRQYFEIYPGCRRQAERSTMHCLIFGFGYMGRIRYQVLREHSDVTAVSVVDPNVDPSKSRTDGRVFSTDAEVPWDTIDAAFIC